MVCSLPSLLATLYYCPFSARIISTWPLPASDEQTPQSLLPRPTVSTLRQLPP